MAASGWWTRHRSGPSKDLSTGRATWLNHGARGRPLNCWAPEIYYDAAREIPDLLVDDGPGPFSGDGGIGDGGQHRSSSPRLLSDTSDSPATGRELFFDGGFNVIIHARQRPQVRPVRKDETKEPVAREYPHRDRLKSGRALWSASSHSARLGRRPTA